MEFVFIPLLLIVVSAGGIFFIVWRKFPQLKKIAESEVPTDNITVKKDWRNVVYDFCPEVVGWLKNIKIEEYKEAWLVETEKFLRRLRVASLKMDRFSDSLIKKVRSKTYPNGTTQTYLKEKSDTTKDKTVENKTRGELEELKKDEQKLIIEIAKNPKNASAYEKLGDLYMKMEDFKDAEGSYEAAIELNPNNEELKKKLSSTLKKLNEPKGSQN
jgi:tetratricopeptide (TPR) repeat protein